MTPEVKSYSVAYGTCATSTTAARTSRSSTAPSPGAAGPHPARDRLTRHLEGRAHPRHLKRPRPGPHQRPGRTRRPNRQRDFYRLVKKHCTRWGSAPSHRICGSLSSRSPPARKLRLTSDTIEQARSVTLRAVRRPPYNQAPYGMQGECGIFHRRRHDSSYQGNQAHRTHKPA